jgi:hypothetical protein
MMIMRGGGVGTWGDFTSTIVSYVIDKTKAAGEIEKAKYEEQREVIKKYTRKVVNKLVIGH